MCSGYRASEEGGRARVRGDAVFIVLLACKQMTRENTLMNSIRQKHLLLKVCFDVSLPEGYGNYWQRSTGK